MTEQDQEYIDYMSQLDPAVFPHNALAARRSFFQAPSGPAVTLPQHYADREVLMDLLEQLMDEFWTPYADTHRARLEEADFSGHEDLSDHFHYLLSIWPAREAMQRALNEGDEDLSTFLKPYGNLVVRPVLKNTVLKQQFEAQIKQHLLEVFERRAKVTDSVEQKLDDMSANMQKGRDNRSVVKQIKHVIFKLRRNYPALVALEPDWLDALEALKPRDLVWKPMDDQILFYLDCALVFLFITIPMLIILEGIF